jgi:hypothetical protein
MKSVKANWPSHSYKPEEHGKTSTGYQTASIAFRLTGSLEYISVCESQSVGNSYIIYRSGRPSHIGLEYPKDKRISWQSFEYSYYLRGGGSANEGLDLNYLSFSNGDWKYTIYQEYTADTNSTVFGVRLVNDKDGEKLDLPGSASSVEGSLVPLRDNERIKRGGLPNGS